MHFSVVIIVGKSLLVFYHAYIFFAILLLCKTKTAQVQLNLCRWYFPLRISNPRSGLIDLYRVCERTVPVNICHPAAEIESVMHRCYRQRPARRLAARIAPCAGRFFFILPLVGQIGTCRFYGQRHRCTDRRALRCGLRGDYRTRLVDVHRFRVQRLSIGILHHTTEIIPVMHHRHCQRSACRLAARIIPGGGGFFLVLPLIGQPRTGGFYGHRY